MIDHKQIAWFPLLWMVSSKGPSAWVCRCPTAFSKISCNFLCRVYYSTQQDQKLVAQSDLNVGYGPWAKTCYKEKGTSFFRLTF